MSQQGTERALRQRQENALRQLAERGAVTTENLAALASLEQRGFVESFRADHGRKRKAWQVTDAGRAYIERISRERGDGS